LDASAASPLSAAAFSKALTFSVSVVLTFDTSDELGVVALLHPKPIAATPQTTSKTNFFTKVHPSISHEIKQVSRNRQWGEEV
jgi:hypothetical protein